MSDADYVVPAQVKNRGTPMTESELKATLWAKINNSISYQGGRLAEYRQQALRYYNGDKFGNEQPGRSQVVSRDVAEAIDSILPSLLRIFTATDDAVRFDARMPQDDELAPQITDYVNWTWNSQNEGFLNFFVWFKAALLDRLGVIKVWWDEVETKTRETYNGLTDEQLSKLVMSGDVEVTIIKSYLDNDSDDAIANLETLAEVAKDDLTATGSNINPGFDRLIENLGDLPRPEMLHDVEAVFTNKQGRIRIAPVPGDEFLIERRAVSVDEAPFVAHRYKMTISDLIELYPDQEDEIWNLPTGEEAEYTMERLERFKQEDQLPWRQDNPADPSMREVWVVDSYIRVDFDGDGYGELRKVTTAGDLGYTILENIETDDHPFCVLCPVPMPFKLFGMSVADQLMDVQLIKSTLWRGQLDNMYNAISPQLGVVENQVNYDDLLTRRPGGIVRMKSAGAIVELPNMMLGDEPLQMIEYLDTVKETRTGVTRLNQGLDAETLNKTASGAHMIANKGAERIETIARIFAETGVKRAFRRILELVCKHQRKKQTIRLRGKFVDIDPREWSTEYDVSINVGLGTGDRSQQTSLMMNLLQMDERIVQMQGGLQGPLVNAENIYHKLEKLLEYSGYKSTDPYYMNPANTPPMPQQQRPDPKMMEIQAKSQFQQQSLQQKSQAEAARIQMDHAKMQWEQQMEAVRMKRDADTEALKAQHDREFETARAQAAMQVEQYKANVQAQLERERMEAEATAKLALARLDAETKIMIAKINAEAKAAPMPQPGVTVNHSLAPEDSTAIQSNMAGTMLEAFTGLKESLAQAFGPKEFIRNEAGQVIGMRPLKQESAQPALGAQ